LILFCFTADYALAATPVIDVDQQGKDEARRAFMREEV